MKQEWQQLYLSMQQEIDGCKKLFPEFRDQTERCFQIAENYWSIVRKEILSAPFSSAMEEIRFYKDIKPIFVSEIRYYELLYHMAWFMPLERPELLKDFWLRELQRLDKFVRDNKKFYDYYKGGCTENDNEWFRKRERPVDTQQPQYDVLACTLLGLEKYSGQIMELIKR